MTVRSTRPRSAPPVYPFTLVQFTNNTALMLPPEVDQRWSEISPLAASERFTLRRRRGIGLLKSHPIGSVNGASHWGKECVCIGWWSPEGWTAEGRQMQVKVPLNLLVRLQSDL